MLGVIVLFGVSWGILRMFGHPIADLGMSPTKRRLLQFLLGMALFAVMSLGYFTVLSKVLDATLERNSAYSFTDLLYSCWWVFRSVLYEELLFRGALLILLMRYFGSLRGVLLSAVVFGVYHWYSYEVVGNIPAMIQTFILTGTGGWIFGYAFYKTRSLYLQTGLHFGWNVITIVLFSQGPLGNQILIYHATNALGDLGGLMAFLFQLIVLPVAGYLVVRCAGVSGEALRVKR